MSSNIASAVSAVNAELEHARAGAKYYQARVEALEKTLAELQSIDQEANGNGIAAPAAVQASRRGRKRKTGMTENGASQELPDLRGEFWIELLDDQPKGKREILDLALQKIGFVPSASQLRKLKQSQAYSLQHHVSVTQRIKDTGKGRARKFYKA